MPPSSTSLSSSPKARIAQSLTSTGVRSTTAPPTAVTGLDSGRTAAERSSPAQRAANAASTPDRAASAARAGRVRLSGAVLVSWFTSGIRRPGCQGLVCHPTE